ncbi:MAG: 3-phosphoshikimate 1-carboxyvinyltransferase [Clostridia bacterium]|nr:3-phosphoshikimate 1-carboxyvinyltransferase [Clostridia bacterium]
MSEARIKPFVCRGKITAPPSKSAAHRALIAACLSGGGNVERIGDSDDVTATLNALSAMGATFTLENGTVEFNGFSPVEKCVIDCKESGSTLRFLLPLCCALGIKARFTGADRLIYFRPSKPLIEVLNSHGADIVDMEIRGKIGCGDYVIDGSVSSQYITGLLFALSACKGVSTLKITGKKVSENYIDMTVGDLKKHGVEITVDDVITIRGGSYSPCDEIVEGDWSGAAFPLTFAAISGEVEVEGLDIRSAQGDKKILDVLESFGAQVERREESVVVKKGELTGTVVDCENIPDLAQIISVAAAYSRGKTILKNLSRLKLKESDRLQGVVDALRLAGINCEISGDDLTITGGEPTGARFTCEPDHRSVMSATILAACASSPSVVTNCESVNKSYPLFFEDIDALGGKGNVEIRR